MMWAIIDQSVGRISVISLSLIIALYWFPLLFMMKKKYINKNGLNCIYYKKIGSVHNKNKNLLVLS